MDALVIGLYPHAFRMDPEFIHFMQQFFEIHPGAVLISELSF